MIWSCVRSSWICPCWIASQSRCCSSMIHAVQHGLHITFGRHSLIFAYESWVFWAYEGWISNNFHHHSRPSSSQCLVGGIWIGSTGGFRSQSWNIGSLLILKPNHVYINYLSNDLDVQFIVWSDIVVDAKIGYIRQLAIAMIMAVAAATG